MPVARIRRKQGDKPQIPPAQPEEPGDSEWWDLIVGAQCMEVRSTKDNTMQLKIEAEASSDMACAFMALLGRDKSPVRMGIKVVKK